MARGITEVNPPNWIKDLETAENNGTALGIIGKKITFLAVDSVVNAEKLTNENVNRADWLKYWGNETLSWGHLGR